MSVLVEAISVIVRIATLEDKYAGGLDAYRAACPNRTFCVDNHLTRVGFMASADAEWFVKGLERAGLTHVRDGKAVDIVVMGQFRGATSPCDWIAGGRHPDGYSAAWLAGTIPGLLATPEGWSVDQSRSLTFLDRKTASERLLGLRRAGGIEIMLDYETGREVYIGRTDRDQVDK